MTTQDFLSAAKLKITEPEREALIEVLAMLEQGECKPFDMSECEDCILGWAQRVGESRVFAGLFLHKDTSDRRLFFPDDDKTYSADQSEAAAALRNYLTSGEPRWTEVL